MVSGFRCGRGRFFVCREIEPGFERMLALEDVPAVFAVRRAHFLSAGKLNLASRECLRLKTCLRFSLCAGRTFELVGVTNRMCLQFALGISEQ